MKIHKKIILVVAIATMALVLAISAFAAASTFNGDTVDHNEVYYGAQVSTTGNVNLKFLYTDLGSAEAMVAEVIDPSGNEIASYEFVKDEIAVKSGKYCITVPLAPSQMTCTVKVYAKSSAGVGEAIEYSVRQYAEDVLANAGFASYHSTMRALLNWGAMAQETFDESTDAIANDGIYSRDTNPIEGLASIPFNNGAVNSSEHITGYKYSVSIEPDNTVMNLYVTYTGEGTLSATVSKNNGEAKETSVIETNVENVYLVRISNLGVAVYDAAYTVTVTDESETFTATKSVLEYLNTLAFTTDENLVKYNDVAKAMYQFYTAARKTVSVESCTHKTIHWVANDENTSFVACSLCLEVMGTRAIGNDVERYLPADMIVDWGTNHGTQTRTLLSDDDGTEYVRIDNFGVRGNWGAWNVFGDANAPVSGQYMVIKFRIGANGLGQTYLKMYTSTQSTGLTDEKQGVALRVAEDNCWHTVVIDLAAQVKNSSGATEIVKENGEYAVSFLAIRPFSGYQSTGSNEAGWTTLPAADDYMDISYIAYCDNIDDIKGVVEEDYYEYAQGSANSHLYVTEDNTNLSLDYNLSLEEIKYHSVVTGTGIGHAEIVKDKNDCDYVRLTPKVTGYGPYLYVNYSAAQGNSGKYLVLKYRTNSPAAWTELYSSTSVVSPTGSEKFWATSQGDEKWHVFILDVEKSEQDGSVDTFVADADGNFAAKHLRLQICYNKASPDYYYDIAVLDWAETIDEAFAKVEGEDIKYGYYNGSKWVDVAHRNDAYDLAATEIQAAANANGYALGSVELKNDAGFDYVRIYNNSTATSNAHWAYSYADAEGVSGQYLIFKYRTNVESGWLQFATSTNEVITDYFADKSQRSWYLMAKNEEWHTVIVDLGQSVSDDGVVRFTENGSDNLAARFIGFRPFYNTLSADDYMDFAYIKWAVTAKEAAEIVAAEINVDFGYYKGGLWNSLELPQ